MTIQAASSGRSHSSNPTFTPADATRLQSRGSRLRIRQVPCKLSLPGERCSCVRASCVASDGAIQAPYGLFLHDLMDQAGIDTTHAKAARKSFVQGVVELTRGGADNSARSNLESARAALDVASEDDALVSHSPVSLPVDSYLGRLNSMAVEFARHHMPSHPQTPEAVLNSLDNYLYGYKSFQRTSASGIGDARNSYLNMVLTRRIGTVAVLAIIYSELVRLLKAWGVIEFVVDMIAPADQFSLPRPVVRRCATDVLDCEAPQLLTPQGLLTEILTTIKDIYWPWKVINGSLEGSNFLKAADAANHGIHMAASAPVESLFTAPSNIMGSEVASARAAKHRLQRGIPTSTSFGDMRRALAATERLVLLGADRKELRDYGILLYHSGLYEPSSAYFTMYNDYEGNLTEHQDSKEAAALEKVFLRLRLILAEQSWNIPAASTPVASPLTDPW